MGWRLTKYIAYKIIDVDMKIKGFGKVLDIEYEKGYAICHEEYIVPVLQSELKQGRYKND